MPSSFTPRAKRSNPWWVLASSFGQNIQRVRAQEDADRRQAEQDRYQEEQRNRQRAEQARVDGRSTALQNAGGDYGAAAEALARSGDAEGADAYYRSATSRRDADRNNVAWEMREGARILNTAQDDQSYESARQEFARVIGEDKAALLPPTWAHFAPHKDTIVGAGLTFSEQEARTRDAERRKTDAAAKHRNDQRAGIFAMTPRTAEGDRDYGRMADEAALTGDVDAAIDFEKQAPKPDKVSFPRAPEQKLVDGTKRWVLTGSDGNFYFASDTKKPIGADRVQDMPAKDSGSESHWRDVEEVQPDGSIKIVSRRVRDGDTVKVVPPAGSVSKTQREGADRWKLGELAKLEAAALTDGLLPEEVRAKKLEIQNLYLAKLGKEAVTVLGPEWDDQPPDRMTSRPPAAPMGPSSATAAPRTQPPTNAPSTPTRNANTPAQNTTRPATGAKTVTRAELERIAQRRGTTVQEQEQRATAAGYTVTR